jgi:hypothetical protein
MDVKPVEGQVCPEGECQETVVSVSGPVPDGPVKPIRPGLASLYRDRQFLVWTAQPCRHQYRQELK